MATNFGTGTNRTIFADGESITSGDLNDISKNAIRRAWEVPGVADLVAFDQMPGTYNDAFKSATALDGRNYGVFTVGGGLCPTSSENTSSVGRGVIGIWTENDAVTLPSASGDGKVLWGVVDTTDGISVTHDNPATDLYRWDLISVSASEVDIATVTRDYKDSTSGAETSEDVVPAKKVQFAYTVTKGAEGAVGAVSVPSAPTGERYLYAAKIHYGESAASVVELHDFTIPTGKLRAFSQMPVLSWWNVNDYWGASIGIGGGLTSIRSDASDIASFAQPDGILGNPECRILGLTVAYKFKTGTTIKLFTQKLDGATANAEVADITTSFNCNNAVHVAAIDLRGLPGSASVSPLWGSGRTTKVPLTDSKPTVLYLRVATAESGGDGSSIYGITWFAVGV